MLNRNCKIEFLEFEIWALLTVLEIKSQNDFMGVILYDIAQKRTLNIVRNYVERINKDDILDLNWVLMGNKNDLIQKRQVSYNEGKRLADQIGFIFMETSAKSNKNLIEAFEVFNKYL